MMGSDARDMMGLPTAAPPKPAPTKAPKPKVKGPSGMAREVLDLNFEGAPPISIVAPKFKEKPKLPFKPRRWEQKPFMNSARKDGFILRHWRREGEAPTNVTGLPATPADSNAASEMDTDDKGTSGIEDSRWTKYNVKVARPQYSQEEYVTHLKNEDWSKEETDYLLDLATDFDLRWVIVGDRYEYISSTSPQDQTSGTVEVDQPEPQAKSRTTEDLKARYYTVAAKCMTLRTPLSSMNPTEFDTHEKMTKYEPKREALRKQYAEKLFRRSPEEAHEEELLLKELSRIVINQEKLYQDRKALYDRLEAPRPINPAAAHASTTVYQSSQGLHQLMQSMMQQQRIRETERREKRRATLGIDTENANSQNALDGRAQRGSIGSASTMHDKRQSHPTPQHRPLTHSERAKFGVSYPQERLTSGVQFRHERVVKASQAKSAVQTSRINDALAELGIPPRLSMPTAKVVTEYERLIEGVKTLVEVRKLKEKVEGEIKIWEHQKMLADGGGEDILMEQAAPKAEEGDVEEEAEYHAEEEKVDMRADSEDEQGESKMDGVGEDDANIEAEEDEAEEQDENEAILDEDVDDQDDELDQDAEGSDASADGDEEDVEDAEDEAEESGVEDEEEDENPSPKAEEGEEDGEDVQEEDTDRANGVEPEADFDESASIKSRSRRKRSASVMSSVSTKSSKRQRK
ncbi:uncharacterized protein KY384_007001 [Bacidia gigantensis]|uniref:uncharacterized protein n=1 Tax=Bacidia gigantensis TaxID=2732470 RepID=UPI001D041CB8|nr:uncharacterized protein KY384_007001 [Bacidia gigantensis]KAG8528085.1 hypothetical protein KY384_007001 [Bacidia gigantensis]